MLAIFILILQLMIVFLFGKILFTEKGFARLIKANGSQSIKHATKFAQILLLKIQ
jgi:hypothetical protein